MLFQLFSSEKEVPLYLFTAFTQEVPLYLFAVFAQESFISETREHFYKNKTQLGPWNLHSNQNGT
jgi:hypothetical protein